ncbi:MAG: hypothetical protein PHP85_06225 [Gallionella sp.]|nr:hypothetical protein [Gallionella sp.]
MKTSFIKTLPIIFLAICIQPAKSHADNLSLVDHGKISGKVIRLEASNLLFHRGQSELKIPFEEIISLDSNENQKITLSSGEIITGRIAVTEKNWKILTRFGELIINKKEISTSVSAAENSFVKLTETQQNTVAARGDTPSETDKNTSQSTAAKEGAPDSNENNKDEKQEISFLRSQAVLLGENAYELSASASYIRNTSTFGADDRALITTIGLKKNLSSNIEGFINIPVGYAQRSFAIMNGTGTSTFMTNKSFDFGDISAGIKYRLSGQTASRPETTLSLTVQAPTGLSPYSSPQFMNARDSLNPFVYPIGTGHWQTTFGAMAFKTVDPVVLFGGISYTHIFPHTYFGFKMQPGNRIVSYGGFGFVISEKSSLSQQVIAEYSAPYKSNGAELGTSAAPVSLKFSYTHKTSDIGIFEPSLQLGLTKDAANAIFSINYSKRY